MPKPIDAKFTKAGYEELKKEQQELIDKRPHVLQRLIAAREQGDLSENAGYHASKEELASIDHRLRELKLLIKYGEVINPSQLETVSFASTVTLANSQQSYKYTIVSNLEANPQKGKISDTSPIGSALIGKKVGETAVIETPTGQTLYKITAIKA